MFHSLSKCTPGGFATSSFIAQSDAVLDIVLFTPADPPWIDPLVVSVNGEVKQTRPIEIHTGDLVSARCLVSSEPLGFDIIPYTLDGRDYEFAVVARGRSFVSFFQDTVSQLWWGWTPSDAHLISYTTDNNFTGIPRELGYNTSNPIPAQITAIPDKLSSAVYFYDEHSLLLDRIALPDAPLSVLRYTHAADDFFLAVCENSKIWKIEFSKHLSAIDQLPAASTSQRGIEWIYQLCFETDIPIQGTITDINRRRISNIDHARPQCLAVDDAGDIWVGGYNTVWKVDKNFNILTTQSIPGTARSIIADLDSVLVTTDHGLAIRIIRQHPSGLPESYTQQTVYSGTWLGNPIIFNNKFMFCDSERALLVTFDTQNNWHRTEIYVDGSAPSYLTIAASSVLIAQHDSTTIKIFDGLTVSDFLQEFPYRVTSIFPTGNGFIASHYLRNIDVLEHRTQGRLEPVSFEKISGPLSAAGTPPVKISMPDNDTIIPVASNKLLAFTNGVAGAPVTNGSWFSVCGRATEARSYCYPVIVGEVALDWQYTASASDILPRWLGRQLTSASEGGVQFDIIIPATADGATLAVDYGEILKNFKPFYDGEPVVTGDIISIKIPFTGSPPAILPMLTVGASHFLLPLSGDPIIGLDHESRTGILGISLEQRTVSISQAGTYYVPPTFSTPYIVKKSPVGDQFSAAGTATGHGAENINAADRDVLSTYCLVPPESGPMDLYIDISNPQIVRSISLMAQYQHIFTPPASHTYIPVNTPRDFIISGSADGLTWNQVAEFNQIPATSAVWPQAGWAEFSFSNNTAYRYWRVQNTSTSATGTSVCAVQMTADYVESKILINAQPAAAGMHDLSVGDTVTLMIGASPRLYDQRAVSIIGPAHIELSVKSAANPSLDYIDFGTVPDAAVRNLYSATASIQGLGSATASISGVDSSTSIRKNSDIVSTLAISVSNGDLITFEKILQNAFENEIYLYQQQTDGAYEDTVNVDCGVWKFEPIEAVGWARDSIPQESYHIPSIVADTGSLIILDRFLVDIAQPQTHESAHFTQSVQHLSPTTTLALGAAYMGIHLSITDKFESQIIAAGGYSSNSLTYNTAHVSSVQSPVLHSAIEHAAFGIGAGVLLTFIKEPHPNIIYLDTFGSILGHISAPTSAHFDTVVAHHNLETATTDYELTHSSITQSQCQSYILAHYNTRNISGFGMQAPDENRYIAPPNILSAVGAIQNTLIIEKFGYLLSEAQNNIGAANLPLASSPDVKLETTPWSSRVAYNRPETQSIVTANPTINHLTALTSLVYSMHYPTDTVWLQTELERYGAFDSAALALAAAVARGVGPVEILAIPGSSKYTYRILYPISVGCPIFPSDRPYIVQGVHGG